MTRSAIIELHKEELTFSAGHFTIFSATEREDLHGHNYSVSMSLKITINHNGMAFDYRTYKQKLLALCNQLDSHFLLPSQSPYLRLEEREKLWIAHFNAEEIPFLKRDVVILPIANVTIEELSDWFLRQLIQNKQELRDNAIQEMIVKVFNGPGQSGGAYFKV